MSTSFKNFPFARPCLNTLKSALKNQKHCLAPIFPPVRALSLPTLSPKIRRAGWSLRYGSLILMPKSWRAPRSMHLCSRAHFTQPLSLAQQRPSLFSRTLPSRIFWTTLLVFLLFCTPFCSPVGCFTLSHLLFKHWSSSAPVVCSSAFAHTALSAWGLLLCRILRRPSVSC